MKKIVSILALLAVVGVLIAAPTTTTLRSFYANGVGADHFRVGLDTNATVYSGALSANPTTKVTAYKITIVSTPSSAIVASDTVKVNLYGSLVAGGTKYLLSSNITAGFGNAIGTAATIGQVDINLTPFPYLYVGYVVTGNEPESKSVDCVVTYIGITP